MELVRRVDVPLVASYLGFLAILADSTLTIIDATYPGSVSPFLDVVLVNIILTFILSMMILLSLRDEPPFHRAGSASRIVGGVVLLLVLAVSAALVNRMLGDAAIAERVAAIVLVGGLAVALVPLFSRFTD